MILKNTGFIPEKTFPQDPKRRKLVLGAGKDPDIIFPDGHGHLKFQPKPQMQFNRKFDTYSCTNFAVAKAIMYDLRERFNQDGEFNNVNISEMHFAQLSGTVHKKGNTIRNALVCPENNGWVDEVDYPFTENTTVEEFFADTPIEIIVKGKTKLHRFKFNWKPLSYSSDVPKGQIVEALKMKVVICAVYAWASENGYYKSYGNPNHATLIVDYKIIDGQVYPIFDDTYPADGQFDTNSTPDEFLKTGAPDFKISSAYICWLELISSENTNVISNLINMIKKKYIVLFHGNEADSTKNTGTFWFLKDNKVQRIDSIGAIMMFLWTWIELFIKSKGAEIGAIKNTDWGEIGSHEITNDFFKGIPE
jgi:hypothetical protein